MIQAEYFVPIPVTLDSLKQHPLLNQNLIFQIHLWRSILSQSFMSGLVTDVIKCFAIY